MAPLKYPLLPEKFLWSLDVFHLGNIFVSLNSESMLNGYFQNNAKCEIPKDISEMG